MSGIKSRLYTLLRWSEKHTKTDMVYMARSGFWLQASSIFISFSSFFLYIVFGHTLSKEIYGTYQYLLSLGAMVAAFTMTGMSTAVTQAVARGFEGTFLTSIRTQLLWSIAPMVGAWGMGAYYLTQGNQTLGIGLLFIGIFVPFNTTFNTFAAYLIAKKDFKRSFYYTLIINIPYYIAVGLVAISLQSAIALLIANGLSQAIGYYIAHRRTLVAYHPNDTVDSEATRYGTHLSIVNAISAVIAQVDNVLVFHLLGAAPLALYSFITAVPDRLGIFKNIGAIAFPKFAIKSHNEVKTSLGRKVALGILVSAIIASIYIAFAHIFFAAFFPRYIDAVPYSQLYALTIIFAFSPVFTTALTAHGRTKELYALNMIAPIIQLSCITAGILLWGLLGLIVGRVASALTYSLFSVVLFSLHQSDISGNQ